MSALPLPDGPLTDGVVMVRPWRADDLGAVLAAGRDPLIPEMTTITRDGTRADARAFLDRQRRRTAEGTGIPLAIADATDGRAVGWIGANRPDLPNRRADIGYWMLDSARGRGLAHRAAGLFVPWLVAALGLVRVEAVIAPDNHASRRVVEQLGFACEGLLRAYMVFPEGLWRGAGPNGRPVSHDMLLYARITPHTATDTATDTGTGIATHAATHADTDTDTATDTGTDADTTATDTTDGTATNGTATDTTATDGTATDGTGADAVPVHRPGPRGGAAGAAEVSRGSA